MVVWLDALRKRMAALLGSLLTRWRSAGEWLLLVCVWYVVGGSITEGSGLTQTTGKVPMEIKDLQLDIQCKILADPVDPSSKGSWLDIGRVAIRQDERLLLFGGNGLSVEAIKDDRNFSAVTWNASKRGILSQLTQMEKDEDSGATLSTSSKLLSFRVKPSANFGAAAKYSNWMLQTSVPLKHLGSSANTLGTVLFHLTAEGFPFGLSYRRQSKEGATLLIADTVALHLPEAAPSPMTLAKQPEPLPGGPKPPPSVFSLIQRYWWIMLVVLLGVTLMGGGGGLPGPQQSSGTGGSMTTAGGGRSTSGR